MEKSRVLVVEDEPFIRKSIATLLGVDRYEILEADTCQEAMQILTSDWVDVLLLDVNLPDMSGLDLLRQIRARPSIGLLPIVVMTAEGPSFITRALEAGADDFLPKPFSGPELKARVATITRLNRYRLLRSEQERFRRLVELAPCGWALVSREGEIREVNRRLVQLAGCAEEEPLIGRHLRELFHQEGIPALERWLEGLTGPQLGPLELSLLGPGEAETPVELQGCLVHARGEALRQILLVDVSAERRSEELLFKSAYLDPLTGLPNRHFLSQLIDEVAMAGEPSLDACPGLLLLDLDHFRKFNESYGHGFGDTLLLRVAQHLESALSERHILARVGADEFAIFLASPCTLETLQALAAHLGEVIRRPVSVGQEKAQLRASFGIAHGWDDGETMLRHAQSAVSLAKQRSRGSAVTYAYPMSESAEGFTTIAGDLRRAIDAGEFFVVYQPMVSLLTHQVLGFEALLRWQHRRLGPISPVRFIPVAEQTGLIVELGNWVIDQACADLAKWTSEANLPNPLSVNVNVSPLQLEDHLSAAFEARILSLLTKFNLRPQDLKLEITESAVLKGSEGQRRFLSRMKQTGVRLQVDDFGTGYSSLAYLTRLPLDALKIDRSFVKRFDSHRADGEVVRAIVNLGVSLGLETVAEGVETQAQADFLREVGCTLAQGYLFARPMGSPQVLRFLRRGEGYWVPPSAS